MDFGLTMSARQEITKKEALEYVKASKKAKGLILDRVQAEIGWSRANARRQLSNALKGSGAAPAVTRKPRSRAYGYDTVTISAPASQTKHSCEPNSPTRTVTKSASPVETSMKILPSTPIVHKRNRQAPVRVPDDFKMP